MARKALVDKAPREFRKLHELDAIKGGSGQ